MVREWAQYVFQELPDQDDTFAAADRFDQVFDGFAAQLRL